MPSVAPSSNFFQRFFSCLISPPSWRVWKRECLIETICLVAFAFVIVVWWKRGRRPRVINRTGPLPAGRGGALPGVRSGATSLAMSGHSSLKRYAGQPVTVSAFGVCLLDFGVV
jgi:hypothetical protein